MSGAKKIEVHSDYINRSLELIEMIGRGGTGEVWSTSDPEWLIKVYNPEDRPEDFEKSKQDVFKRYSAFSACKFDRVAEVECLPVEALRVEHPFDPDVGCTPAYLMKRAKGQIVESVRTLHKEYSLLQRLFMARSATKAILILHGKGIVHSDIKLSSFFLHVDQELDEPLMQVIDIDGGGVRSNVTGHGDASIPPVVRPSCRYMPIECVKKGRSVVWNSSMLWNQPDLWSLAVLVYELLVDHEGPFPSRRQVDDPYGKYFRLNDVYKNTPAWPKHWQDERIKRLDLNAETVAAFDAVFAGAKRADDRSLNRPSADTWFKLLEKEIQKRLRRSGPVSLLSARVSAAQKRSIGRRLAQPASGRIDGFCACELQTQSWQMFLMLNGSGGMLAPDTSGVPKHRVEARLVQRVINFLCDCPGFDSVYLTVLCWDLNNICDVRLSAYDVKSDEWYYRPELGELDPYDEVLDQWDPLVGHGADAPTGRALAAVREMAERWVQTAMGNITHRAGIFCVTDGLTSPAGELNGSAEKDLIARFNIDYRNKGIIKLFGIGLNCENSGTGATIANGCKPWEELLPNPRLNYVDAQNFGRVANMIDAFVNPSRCWMPNEDGLSKYY